MSEQLGMRKRVSLIQPEMKKAPESFFENAAKFDEDDSDLLSGGFFSQAAEAEAPVTVIPEVRVVEPVAKKVEVDSCVPDDEDTGDGIDLVEPEEVVELVVCKQCGAELPKNAKFCVECGARVSDEDSPVSLEFSFEDTDTPVLSGAEESDTVELEFDEGAQEGNAVLNKLADAVEVYQAGQTADFDEFHITYEDGVREVQVKDRAIMLPIHRIFMNGHELHFNSVGEANVPEGKEIEVDFGISILSPSTVKIIMCELESTLKKFGLKMISDPVVNRQDALFRLTARFVAEDNIAYVNKYKSLACLKLVSA